VWKDEGLRKVEKSLRLGEQISERSWLAGRPVDRRVMGTWALANSLNLNGRCPKNLERRNLARGWRGLKTESLPEELR